MKMSKDWGQSFESVSLTDYKASLYDGQSDEVNQLRKQVAALQKQVELLKKNQPDYVEPESEVSNDKQEIVQQNKFEESVKEVKEAQKIEREPEEQEMKVTREQSPIGDDRV